LPPAKNKDQDKQIPRAILPYYGNVTDQIARYIRRNTELEIGYIPVNRLASSLTKVKDSNYKEEVGVYKIPCLDCPAIYIGETFRDIKIRADEHKHNLETFNTNDSAVAAHALDQNHRIGFNQIQLVERETNYFRRKMKETLQIRQTKLPMNKDHGMNFNPIWLNLLLPNDKPP